MTTHEVKANRPAPNPKKGTSLREAFLMIGFVVIMAVTMVIGLSSAAENPSNTDHYWVVTKSHVYNIDIPDWYLTYKQPKVIDGGVIVETPTGTVTVQGTCTIGEFNR